MPNAKWTRKLPNNITVAAYGKMQRLTEKTKNSGRHLAGHLLRKQAGTLWCMLPRSKGSPPGRVQVVDAQQAVGTTQAETYTRQTDAIITQFTQAGDGIIGQSRDCPLIALYAPDTTLAALVHAGRDELAAGVVEETLTIFRNLGTHHGTLHAFIMVSISPQHFAHEQCPEKCTPLIERYGREAVTCHTRYTLDLPGIIKKILTSHGVTQITHDGLCTYTNAGLGSHRAQNANMPEKESPNTAMIIKTNS